MLIWMTIQIFQFMFGTNVSEPEILGVLYIFAFTELLIEIGLALILVGLFFMSLTNDRKPN